MKTLELNNLTDSQSELIQSLFNEFTKMNTKTNDNLSSFINEIISETDELNKEKERVSLIKKEFTTLLSKQIDEDVQSLNESLIKLNLKAYRFDSIISIRVINDPSSYVELNYMLDFKRNKYNLKEAVGLKICCYDYSRISSTSKAKTISELLPMIKNRIKLLYEISLKK